LSIKKEMPFSEIREMGMTGKKKKKKRDAIIWLLNHRVGIDWKKGGVSLGKRTEGKLYRLRGTLQPTHTKG